jgi:hypothetical protein
MGTRWGIEDEPDGPLWLYALGAVVVGIALLLYALGVAS